MAVPNGKGEEKLDSLRERLYARDGGTANRARTKLTDTDTEVPGDWAPPASMSAEAIQETQVPARETSYSDTMPYKGLSKKYRLKIVLAGVVFFVIALALSSIFLIWGNNTISGENITIDVSGPFAVGGGEEMSLQIAIANKNAIAIESATLIIEFPPGTQSVENPGQDLTTYRKSLESIDPGEIVSVPVKALMFGEENSEKMINVLVEYRVRGSNATFFKEAEPLRLKISSSPVVLLIDSSKSITSGQETEIKLTVGSNSPTTLSRVLVQASYPFGFDFSSADPEPNSGQGTWLIDELDPEETVEITLRGVITGKENDERVFDFSVGVPNERDRFTLASVYTTGKAELAIEDPFLGVDVSINGDEDDIVIVESGESAAVEVSFRNSLEETLYDGIIEVKLAGTALNQVTVSAEGGFYNSSSNTIRWDGTDESSLKEMTPGQTSAVSFTLTPKEDVSSTPEVTLSVTVKGKRVYDDRVPEELVSTATRTLRVESQSSLSSMVLHSQGAFSNDGPIPPVAEETTEFTINFTLANGSNDITEGEMTAVLPQYVEWLNRVTSGDVITYNETSRTLTWKIGNVSANSTEEASIQVGVTPSVSQVGKVPTIVETQRFKAKDRFTGTLLRSDASALTTALPNDSGVSDKSGRVRAED